MVCSLVSINFDSLELAKQYKQNILNFRILIHIYAQFWFFEKGSGYIFSNTFCEWIFKKNVSQVILTDQISLPDCLYLLRYWSLCILQLFVSQPSRFPTWGDTKLICWSTGPTDPILWKNKKILQNFGQPAFF